MPFTIVYQDITKIKADAIVNATNTKLSAGGGVCGAIFLAAGKDKLEAACAGISPIQTGEAVITPGFALPAKYIIHAAGPIYNQQNEAESERLLREAYINSLQVACENHCESIAFLLISSGIYGYPKKEALRVAISAIKDFLEHQELNVYLVIFDKTSFDVEKELLDGVENYLSKNYKEIYEETKTAFLCNSQPLKAEKEVIKTSKNYGKKTFLRRLFTERNTKTDKKSRAAKLDLKKNKNKKADIEEETAIQEEISKSSNHTEINSKEIYREKSADVFESADHYSRKNPGKQALDRLVDSLDEPFSTTLLRLIDMKGRTDVEVYKRANIDRKLFSKIRTNANYMPSKRTALALAVALELNVKETNDLLKRAGFALSHSQKFDVIVEYFLVNKDYDIFKINEVLFQYDQPLLGG